MNALPPKNPSFGWSDVFMLLVTLIWGLNFSIIKISLRELSPAGFNGLRLLLTAAVLVGLMAASGESFRVGRSEFWKLAALGIMSHALYQILFIGGLSRTTASNSSFILSFSPAIVALIGGLLRIEKVRWGAALGIVISAAGLYLVIAGGEGGIRLLSAGFQGDVMIFAGTILWSLNTVFSKEFLERLSPLKFTAITVGLGALAYFPFCAGAISRISWRSVSPAAWAGLGFSAVFSLVVGYLVWYVSVRRVGNVRTAVYSNLTPVFTALFALLILGEALRPRQIGGAAVILLGVFLARTEYGFFLGGRNGIRPAPVSRGSVAAAAAPDPPENAGRPADGPAAQRRPKTRWS
ncbi:MAG TPA: DMT family transporter [Candidatus Aminicenantes bacterium]|nr:DMT family transporter [Candidatus Aminicenantes bacterium]HNT32330.1 DMT family transporter [Candidatus Aminicenantes bacterium]HOF83077.1 DMT family transporter [Candidatus Aminicenantes bacterium]HOS11387.1 DMT family transporter [Candidatus Aminicenantes bacterium]HOU48240.1 DMT family transporter [Candidatus Aminicenantes bacterium]